VKLPETFVENHKIIWHFIPTEQAYSTCDSMSLCFLYLLSELGEIRCKKTCTYFFMEFRDFHENWRSEKGIFLRAKNNIIVSCEHYDMLKT
jgi:hypothetical protein